MRVTLQVELDIEPFEGSPTSAEQESAVLEAVENAILWAQGEGHRHRLAETTSIMLANNGVTVVHPAD